MMRGSSYLGSTPKRALSRPRRFGSLAALLLVVAVFFSGFASLPLLDSLTRGSNDSGSSAVPLISDASALWCSDPKEGNLGQGMNNTKDWRSGSAWYPHAETSGRVLTAQEAFGNGTRFTNFNGAGESPALPWFWISPPLGLPQADDDTESGLRSVVSYTGNTPQGEGADGWFDRMNGTRTPTNCFMGAGGMFVANGVLAITSGVTNLMGGISTFAFDPNFICEPNSGATNCIDLVGIIGGGSSASDTGIIGKLTTSVYFPLLLLAALLVGLWIVWNGLVKRQFRETLIGALWSVVTVILGIGLLLNPLMLAKAPMVVGNALTSCIVGAFTGSGGCDGGSSNRAESGASAYCDAWSNKSNFMDQAAITMTSMSCELWKAFVLQPYAQGSFGASLDELDTRRSNTIASQLVAKNPGFDRNTFCVDTKVQGSLTSHFGNTLNLGNSGEPICNLAIYQAYLGVDAKMETGAGGNLPAAGAIDGRWLKLAQVAATDEGMYRAWAPNDLHLAQIGMALIGMISAILAAVVVFVVAAFALAFYVTSILMIAFAPFFLLAGVHPGKGRKMMIGWIGQVLSNLMKYAASAIFLVITVALYGAVLSNVSNPGAILIFMIILTVALLMYRREIVDMVGAIDLGGEKLSNKFAEKTMDRVRNAGKTTMAVGAGLTAGALSNGSLNPLSLQNLNPQNMVDTLRAGADAGRRSIKSRPGALGEVMKASDRISADNRADMSRQANAATDIAKKAATERGQKERGLDKHTADLRDSRETTEQKLENLSDRNTAAREKQFGVQTEASKLEGAQTAALGAVDNSAFREYQDLLNQMKNLEIKATIAQESGLTEEAAAYRSSADSLRESASLAFTNLSDEDLELGKSQYDSALAENLGREDVDSTNASEYEEDVRSRYQGIMQTIGGTAFRANELKAQQEARERQLQDSISAASAELEDAKYREATTTKASDLARNRVIDFKPGQVIKNTDVRKNAQEIAALQNDRSRDVHELSSKVEEGMLASSEGHADALTTRDSLRQAVGTQREKLAESQTAAQRIGEVRKDVQQAKDEAVSSWKSVLPQTPEDRAKRSYVSHIDAEAQANRAASKVEALTAKESEGAISGIEKADLFAARREEEVARERMASSERVIRTAGSDLGSMRSQLQKAVEAEYAKKPSARSMKMDEGLESFERNLDETATSVQSEIASRRVELQRVQESEAAAARQADVAQREAERLANAARALREQAAGDKPVTDKGVSKATAQASKIIGSTERNGGRGLPRMADPVAPAAAAEPTVTAVPTAAAQPIEPTEPPVAQRPVAQPAEPTVRPVAQQPTAQPVADTPTAPAPATAPAAPQGAPQPAPKAAPQPAPQVAQPAPRVAPEPAPQTVAPATSEVAPAPAPSAPVPEPVRQPAAQPRDEAPRANSEQDQALRNREARQRSEREARDTAARKAEQDREAERARAQERDRSEREASEAARLSRESALRESAEIARQREADRAQRAATQDAERRVRDAETESQRRVSQAQNLSNSDLRESADRRVREINRAAEDQLREIETRRADLASSMDRLGGGSRLGRDYGDLISELERVASANDLTEQELRESLDALSREGADLTDRAAQISSSLAPQAEEIQQGIEDQISRIGSLRAESTKPSELRAAPAPSAPSNGRGPRAADNIRGADDGNPLRGGNPFKR